MATETPVAPTEDELAARRATSQKEREATADFDATANGQPSEGQSIEDMEADGSLAEEDDGQVAFVYEHGRKVTFGTLIKRGTPVEYHVKFGGKSVKGKGEPIPLEEKDLMLLGTFVVGGYSVDAIRDDDDNVSKVKVYAKLKPKSYVDGRSEAARVALLGEGTELARLVNAGRRDGASDAQIRTALVNEIDAALSA